MAFMKTFTVLILVIILIAIFSDVTSQQSTAVNASTDTCPVPSAKHNLWGYKVEAGCTCTNIKDCIGVTGELVRMVKLQGWKCDSLSNVHKSQWDGNFMLNCDRNSHVYEIEDMGGRWIVIVKD